jgi:D-alanine-D-alanine ligase
MHVAVVEGGPSTEAEVSRMSARGVAEALAQAGHLVTRVELEPAACEALRMGGFDVVFPVVHGAFGEDGCLQGVLEVLGLPYVGSDVLASALAMNKSLARVVFAATGCPIARGVSEPRGESLTCAKRARAVVGAAVVVKPSSSGSAIGVARFEASAADADVAAAIDAAWKLDDVVIVEEFVKGREVTCSVLDVAPDGPRVLAATEISSPHDAFYTYEARYAAGRSVHICPAELGDLTNAVHEAALMAHAALGCRDLSRADFVVGDRVVLLEVNTIPGMTATSLYPEAGRAAGLSFADLCNALVENARRCGPRQRQIPRSFPA